MGLSVKVYGNAHVTGQSQRVLIAPWLADTVNTVGPQTVGAAAQAALTVGAAGYSSWAGRFVNESTSGQNLGLGFDNTVTMVNAGIIIKPGDAFSFGDVGHNIFVIASAAGAVMRRMAVRTN